MNKEQAIEFIWQAAAQGMTPRQVAAELSQQIGAPLELSAKFVAQVLASPRSNQSTDLPAASATAAAVTPQNPQEESAELDALILQALLKQKNHSDLVMLVCERTGMSWEQAEKRIEQVQEANKKKVVGRENLVFIPVSVAITIAGFFLLWASADEMFLALLVLLKLEPHDPMLSSTLREAPLLFWLGLGLFLGGGVGLYKALQSHFQLLCKTSAFYPKMKTYILQLEPHDDLVSLQDKLKWARAERILIVWPEQGVLFSQRLDLKRLQRQCAALGAQAALVCRDPEVRYHALRLGMPVFANTKRAESAPWRLPRRFRQAEKTPLPALQEVQQRRQALQSRRPPKPAPLSWPARLALFTLGVAAILALAAVLAPGAVIYLTPVTQIQSIEIEIRAGTKIPTTNLSGILPAQEIEIVVEGRRSLPTSGTIQIPGQAATGKVVFTNLTDQVIAIPVNTVVRPAGNPGLAFLVTQAGEAPAGPGQTVELPVRCQTPGSAGNLPPNSLAALEGILGTQVTVNNPDPIQGGSEQTAPAPSAADRRKLAAELENSLAQTAREEIQNQLAPGDLLILESLQQVETLEEAYEPADAQPASQLDLSLRLKYRALMIAGLDLEKLGRVALSAQAPAGFAADPASLQATLVSTPVFQEDGLFHFTIQAQQRITAQIDASRVVQRILGQAPGQASQHLQHNFSLEKPPEIVLHPSWWPRLPVLPFRIEVHTAGAVP